jgi:RHS repeat-associated protein
MYGRRAQTWCGLILVLAASSAGAQAQSSQGSSSSVDPFYGAFGTAVPIAVPAFRGLEPSLRLTYSSASGSSQVGAGWALSGFSTIERASPGKGVPRYDGSDLYLLDGQELVPCAAGSTSPSCTTGGTHSTRIESYQRIRYDAAANTWTVWGKDGTRQAYAPLFPAYRGSALAGTYRWGLSSVVDTSGNTVSYGWWCDGSPVLECYPDSVSYNGYTVRLYREPRPEPTTFANGSSTLGSTRFRLKSVDVTVGGSRVRAYRLTYTVSASTGRSLLASIQQFGRDAVLDATGTLTAGSALPPLALGWSGSASSRQLAYSGSSSTGETYWASVVDSSTYRGKALATDINGDGRGDVVMLYQDVNNRVTVAHHWLSDGSRLQYTGSSSTSTETYWTSVVDSPTYRGRVFPMDVNGDGRGDVVMIYQDVNSRVTLAQHWISDGSKLQYAGSTSTGETYWASVLDSAPHRGKAFAADVNGDGRGDVVMIYQDANNRVTVTHHWLSDGSRLQYAGATSTGETYWASVVDSTTYRGKAFTTDVNGDGRSDVVMIYQDVNNRVTTAHHWLSDGSRLQYAGSSSTATETYWTSVVDSSTYRGQVLPMDVNGDGRGDMVMIYQDVNNRITLTQHWLSDGSRLQYAGSSSTATETYWSSVVDSPTYKGRTFVSDVNGDGRGDMVMIYQDVNNRVTLTQHWLSDGSRLQYAGATSTGETYWATVVDSSTYRGKTLTADVNGDGRGDVVMIYQDVNNRVTLAQHWLAAGTVPDLLTSLSNGLGGSTTVQYRPSSAWSNTYLPTVLQTTASVTTSDGRGASSTTHYQYQGGLWSSSERRFLGFRRVTAALDAAGNYTETYYHQGVGCISKPDATYYRDAAGNIYSYTSYTYSENAAPPYTSLLTQRWDYECNLTASCRRVLTQFAYDQFGNATASHEYGDYDLSGDERTTLRGYVPNTSAYVVASQAYENVYAGIGTAGALLQQKLYAYDGATSYTTAPTLGRLTQVQAWNSLTGGYLATRYTYDAWGNQTSTLNPLGVTTNSTTYDSTFRTFPTRECDALGRCTSRTWDTALGLETSNTDANGVIATTTYDAFGRPLTESKSGRQVQYSYLSWGDPHNQRIRRTLVDGSADGLWEDTYSDGLGRVWRQVKEGGATQDTLYSDASTRPWRRSGWYAPGEVPRYQVYAYDGAGRVRSVTNPDGTQARLSYGVGFTVALNELGHEKVTWVDPWGRTTQIREKNGSTYGYTTYGLDPLGRVGRVTDAAGNAFTYTYNSLGWKVSECDPDVGCLSYTYDGAGNLLTQRNARNELTTYAYDAGGRRTSRTWPDGSRMQWSYDQPGHGFSLGRLTSVTDPNGSESFTYDSLGRAVATTKCVLGTCQTLQQAYDSMDRVTSLTYPDGEVVTYAYDSTGRLASVSGYVQSMTYNAAGQLLSARYANGTTATYNYDANRQWILSSQVGGPAGTLYQASYSYDAAARVTGTSSSTNPLLNLAFTYDELSRLTQVLGSQPQSFAYDAIGNLTWNSQVGSYAYTHPGKRHAVSAAGSQSYTYDAAGNMLSGGGRTYTWNYDHQLVSVSNGSGTTRFLYDYSGQRVYKFGPSGTHLYFGAFVEMRNGALVKNYYAGPQLVATRDSSGPRWYHADHLGSTRLVTSASGAVLERYDYSAFGATVQGSGSVSRRFGGHHTDPETGLVYMNARYYDPQLGRFLSADSLVPDPLNPQAFNRYAFAYNNPISNLDPTGHAPVVAAAVAVATALSSGSALSFVALVGAATTVAGYVLKDPVLSTIGSVLLGFVGGGPVGAAVAAATSPLSPLDPKLKQTIGWAYTAYGLFQELNGMLSEAKVPEAARIPGGSAPVVNETGNVSIIFSEGKASVHVRGIFSGEGTPLWDRISRDVQDFFANMTGELGPTGRFVQQQLQARGIDPSNVFYVGHSMGSWTGITLARNGVVGNVVGMAVPLPALAQLSERPVQGFNLTILLGAGDPVSGMLAGSGAGYLAVQNIGATVRVLGTGGHSVNAHMLDNFCRVSPANCMR